MKRIHTLWIVIVLLMAAALLWPILNLAQLSGLLQRAVSVRSAADALGLAAYLALWAGCCLGLLAAGSSGHGAAKTFLNRAHAGLLLAALLLGLLHPLLLLCYPGSFLHVYQIFLPFTAPYHPVLYGLGTLAFYGMFLIALSGVWRLPRRHSVWKALHLCAYLVYLFALAHGMAGGPHAGSPVYLGLYAATCIFLLALVVRQLHGAAKQKVG